MPLIKIWRLVFDIASDYKLLLLLLKKLRPKTHNRFHRANRIRLLESSIELQAFSPFICSWFYLTERMLHAS